MLRIGRGDRFDQERDGEKIVAKITEQTKKLIIADYLTGKFSQRELAKKHNISLGAANKITKDLTPENERYVEAEVTMISARQTLPDEQMNAIMNAAKDEAYNRGLIFNATQKNLAKITEMLNKNTKFEKVGVGDGVQNFEPVELNANDYKALQDAIDKASLTLGVNQRTSSTTINNANVQQSEETKIVIERRELNGDE
nr:MAG TPA: Helix-turn-helix of DDE superfamily endonuclease [Caudoviricetes sp.]